ncbi:sn-glycerol-3-phosphate ABC transporter ATP-binding protein UgpC [Atopobacter sp. AH10]|uniref:ABC transporter ATP-binding protein n=1 Tax=Atopobacter sp. AH10 TaxID=2315861 RepID=UPI000EF17619|nr:sn-glycerol-3-phosphate ABC transporter ATP-binding protein UgpC [Atopobacter sp. AH10]RLK64214.1 sn-glycerol-3-phosphate ABC transporter ATP-binding protein UgpC [Atopobacter sp. AH10]
MVKIDLNHIHKKYPNADTYSVTDFNLHIDDKEFIVFVGPSGCGKSTTLRMIAGLEDISEGELLIDGQVMNDVEPKNRNIAMVFQNYALYPHMTVFDNMAFGLKLKKYPKDEIKKRVEDAALKLGLSEYLERKPAALSGGQRQRVALGRAIVRDANVFLMDEPLSNLDAKLRVQMRAEIAKLHQSLGTTTIYVTHDQTEAMTMATRIVIMKDGIVQQIGTPQEVYNRPVNMFVAGFIGSPAANFFKVRVEDDHVVSEDGLSLKLHEPATALLADRGYNHKEVIMAIRPEDIQSEQIFIDSNPDKLVQAKVVVAELLGSESMLYSMIGKTEFVAKVNARENFKPGDEITLGFNMNKCHFFDLETEKVIRA